MIHLELRHSRTNIAVSRRLTCTVQSHRGAEVKGSSPATAMAFTNLVPLRVSPCSRPRTTLKAPVCTAAPPTATPERTRPPGISGQLVNAIISVPPIWALVSAASRSVIAGYARRGGIEWAEHVRSLELLLPESTRAELLASVTDPSLEYPSYYIAPFHAYSMGNMGWKPAFEALPASVAIAYRTMTESGFSIDGLSPQDLVTENRAQTFAASFELFPAFKDELSKQKGIAVVDAGSGVGLGTKTAHREMKRVARDDASIDVVGIDASPYMIAVARATIDIPGVDFEHQLMEKTKFEDGSQDMFCLQHVVHEIPDLSPTMQEGFRVLRKGGMLIIIDNDPESKGISNLNPALLTLLKSTEPYCDFWWTSDVEGVGRSIGFSESKSTMVSDRHRLYVLIK